MIRYSITREQLRAKIIEVNPSWFERAAAALKQLPTTPGSSDFPSLWSEIKKVYAEIQNAKCCFCEKPLEGAVEQDLEHFRPKAEVKHWAPPARLLTEGVVVEQPADGKPEPGYTQLAYEPLNYAVACKTCNSTFKKNFFPIEGPRDSKADDPATLKNEQSLLIYPIGSLDDDPEDLLEFVGISPVPKAKRGFKRRRAMVTIELFQLDSATRRRSLFKARAWLVRLLFLELEGLAAASADGIRRNQHQVVIDALTASTSPFASCLRSFARLHGVDRAQAESIADACAKLVSPHSPR